MSGIVFLSMTKKQDHDFSVRAFRVVEHATRGKDVVEDKASRIGSKNPHAVELGRLGGLKGGKARFEKLTPEQRKEIAQKAARKRWEKK